MMRTPWLPAMLAIAPRVFCAQQPTAIERLRVVLPAEVAATVSAIVTDASRHGLPGPAIAERALEANARGQRGTAVSAAAQTFAADLSQARDALQRAGRTPDVSEIEGAASARELGVDARTISALATRAPSGRSLATPFAVIGALVNRGVPADQALAAVLARLERDASDASLAAMLGEEGRGLGEGYKASDVGRAPGATGRPLGVPVNGGHAGPRPRATHP